MVQPQNCGGLRGSASLQISGGGTSGLEFRTWSEFGDSVHGFQQIHPAYGFAQMKDEVES